MIRNNGVRRGWWDRVGLLAGGLCLAVVCGCATDEGTTGGPTPARDSDRSARDQAGVERMPIGAAPEFRSDRIEAFREPLYGIEGRPVVLLPVPPRDLMSWWLPTAPELREADSGRRLSVRLVWLAGSDDADGVDDDARAWLGGSLRWSSMPAAEAERLALSTLPAERNRLGQTGMWVVLADGLRPGESIALQSENGQSSERLMVRWFDALPAGASDLAPLHPPHWSAMDQAAGSRLATSVATAWNDPMQRWRVRLLADRFGGGEAFVGRGPDGVADAVIDEIAAQFERLWREAFGSLMSADAASAVEVLGAVLPLAELLPGTPMPVWRTDAEAEWAMLTAMLEGPDSTARARGIARAMRESRVPLIGWIAQDALPGQAGFDPERAAIHVAELHGRMRRAVIGTGGAGVEVPAFGVAEIVAEPGAAGAETQLLTLRSGALTQPLVVAPRATPVVAPRFSINALWRAWTLDGFLSGRPSQAVVARGEQAVPATVAMLTRDTVNQRWILFVECLRDADATEGDEVRVWFGDTEPLVVEAGGGFRIRTAGGSDASLLAHEILGDRWSATIALGDSIPAERGDDGEDSGLGHAIRFALQRSERLSGGGSRTSSWPRPRLPWENDRLPPGTMGLDLSAWERELEDAASFELLRDMDRRNGREVFDAWREDDAVPGPLP